MGQCEDISSPLMRFRQIKLVGGASGDGAICPGIGCDSRKTRFSSRPRDWTARGEFEWGARTQLESRPLEPTTRRVRWGALLGGLAGTFRRPAAPRSVLFAVAHCMCFPLPPAPLATWGAMAKSTFPLDSLLTALPADLSSALFAKAHEHVTCGRSDRVSGRGMQATVATGSKMAC